MSNEIDWDIYEVFKEQIEDQLPIIEIAISNLNKPDYVGEAIDDLFREFHNYKATANYLNLKPMQDLAHKAETVLGSLRENKKVVQESLILWLKEVKDQFDRWLEQVNKHESNLSEVLPELNKKIKISKSYISSADKLKTLNIYYLDNDYERASKVISFLKKISDKIELLNLNTYEKNIENDSIVITNLEEDNYDVIEYCLDNFTNLPVISIFDNINKKDKIKLLKSSNNQYILNPLDSKKLHNELRFTTKSYFNSKNILIDNQRISTYIKTIKPLPNTIFKIEKVCDDEDKSINDLIKVIKTDPIISATILKSASKPIYGSTNIATIDQAITRLGKNIIKALALSKVYKNIMPISLNAYGINENKFSNISANRNSLMLKWYSKVNIGDLSILSSTAMLSDIGQLLISLELIDMYEDENFRKLFANFGTSYAEESILHTTSCLVSAQILKYWKLSDHIIDVILHTNNPDLAPKEIMHLAVANHIVYTLVDSIGTISQTIPPHILNLMQKHDLDVKPLEKALKFIVENN